jgi:hypothetical protein
MKRSTVSFPENKQWIFTAIENEAVGSDISVPQRILQILEQYMLGRSSGVSESVAEPKKEVSEGLRDILS